MKIEIYVESKVVGEYNLLDLFEDESFNMEFKLKDMADLAKVFSTYTKEITIPASTHNNQVLNHYFDQGVQRSGSRYIKCKIYINQQIFRTGTISVLEGKYINNRLSSYKIYFNTGLTSLKDRIGSDELNSLDLNYLDLDWTPIGIRNAIQNPATSPEIIIPMVSREKVWTMEGSTEDNISTGGTGFIQQSEVRPAIKLRTIVDKIFTKYGLNVNLPFRNEGNYNQLYLWCNNKTDDEYKDTQISITQPSTTNGQQDPSAYFSGQVTNNSYKINFTGAHTDTNLPYELYFNLGGVRDPFSNAIYEGLLTLTVEDDQGNTYITKVDADLSYGGSFYISTPIPVPSGATSRTYRIFIGADKPVKYDAISIYFRLRNPSGGFYGVSSVNNTSTTIQNKFRFQTAVGNIKIIDIITSLIKMYNITILEEKNSDLLNFLRPSDIRRRLLDFTEYMDVGDFTKMSNDIKKEVVFTHKDSDFFRNKEYKKLVGKEYGAEVYTSTDEMLSGDYTVETSFNIMNWFKIYGGNLIMSYGFDSPGSPIDSTDSIVIMARRGYYDVRNKDGVVAPIYVGDRNLSFTKYVGVGNQTADGESITFDIDISPQDNTPKTKSLYSKYYSHVISRMYEPNSRLAKYDGYLPTEVLNNFSMVDEVIIGDTKFSIEEASIDISTGKSKLTLMNIVADGSGFFNLPQPPTLFGANGIDMYTLRVVFNGSSAKAGVKGHWIEYRVAGSPTWINWGFREAEHNNQVSYQLYIEDLQPDTTYDVRVRTEDNLGNFSEWKATTGTTLSTNDYILNPPTTLHLIADEFDGTKVSVGWNNFEGVQPTEELEGYEIQWKRETDTVWASMFDNRTWSDQQSYIIFIEDLVPNTTYTVRMRSRDILGRNSAWISDTVTTSDTGGSTTLPTPVLFDIASPFVGTLEYTWTGKSVSNSEGVEQYECKWELAPNGVQVGSEFINIGTSTQYTKSINGLPSGVYKCNVRAVGANNTYSAWSGDKLQTVE